MYQEHVRMCVYGHMFPPETTRRLINNTTETRQRQTKTGFNCPELEEFKISRHFLLDYVYIFASNIGHI